MSGPCASSGVGSRSSLPRGHSTAKALGPSAVRELRFCRAVLQFTVSGMLLAGIQVLGEKMKQGMALLAVAVEFLFELLERRLIPAHLVQ